MNNARPLSLKGRALRFLAQREHSRAELERKLAPHCADDPGEPARTLDLLEARGLLSESRYVESVLHRRAPRLGAARIRQELAAKGVGGEALSSAIKALRSTELDRAKGVWSRRFGEAPGDAAERAAQMRFLLARGFAAEVVRQVVSQAAQGDDASPEEVPLDD